MDDSILRSEHEAFTRQMQTEHKRLEDEDRRQNRRLDELEEQVRQIGTLAAAVEKLATSMEGMLKEQERQGKRLETLEGRDGEKWRGTAAYIITAILGIVIGFIFKHLGI